MRITALVACLLLSLCSSSRAGLGPVSLDVVFMDETLFFVLDKPRKIDYVVVSFIIDTAKPGRLRNAPDNRKVMWLLGQDVSTPVKSRKYPTLGQIRYGQKLAEFPRVEGPVALEREVEYHVKIDMLPKFAIGSFKISKDGAVTVTGFRGYRPLARAYTVSTDKDGEKTLVAAPASR